MSADATLRLTVGDILADDASSPWIRLAIAIRCRTRSLPSHGTRRKARATARWSRASLSGSKLTILRCLFLP